MKRFIGLGILTIFMSIACFLLLEDHSIEQIVDVQKVSDNRLLVLQKEAVDDAKESLINRLKLNYQLLLTDYQGHLIQNVKLPDNKRSTFSEYGDIVVDSTGNCYIHRVIKDAETYYVKGEEILRFSLDSSKIETLHTLNYDKIGGTEYSLISKVYIVDRFMYIVHKDYRDENFWQVTQINLYSKASAIIQALHMNPELQIFDMLYLGNQRTVLASVSGNLYVVKNGKVERMAYVPKTESYYPARLLAISDHEFAFYDQLTRRIMRFDLESQKYEVLRSATYVIDKATDLTYQKANIIHVGKDLTITGAMRINQSLKRYVFVDQGSTIGLITTYQEKNMDRFVRYMKIFVIFSGIYLVSTFSILAYRRGRGALTIKFTVLLLPLVLTIPIISLTVSFNYFSTLAKNDLLAELHRATTERAPRLDIEALKQINGLEDYQNADYKKLDAQRVISADAFNAKRLDTYSRWYYSVIYRVIDGKIHVCVGDGAGFWTPTDYTYGEKGNQVYLDAVNKKVTTLGENSDLTGEWVFSVTPILDNKGAVIGLFEVGTGTQSYNYFIQSYYGKLVILNIVIVLIVLILFVLIIFRTIKPLRTLSDTARDITLGNWGRTVDVRSHDEIGVLSGLFNKMSLFISDHISELTKLNTLYFKFIPLQFFHLMNKTSIIEVSLGDHSSQEMTIVYINTYNYFDLVKGKNSKDQLDQLNRLFEEYAKAIHAQDGIVGEFRNAGLLALFKEQKNALDAAYMITQRMNTLDEAIKTTVNIHYGDALLGVVGDENRMTTAVISSCVNEAVALDKYAGKFNCAVLLTEAFIKSLSEKVTNARYIGEIFDEHKQVSLRVSEWLETIPLTHQNDYFKSQLDFAEALKAFESEDYMMAKKGFVKVIKENPRDLVSKEYLYKCERALAGDLADDRPLGRF